MNYSGGTYYHEIETEREGEGKKWYSSDQLLNEVENYSIVKAIGNEGEPAVHFVIKTRLG